MQFLFKNSTFPRQYVCQKVATNFLVVLLEPTSETTFMKIRYHSRRFPFLRVIILNILMSLKRHFIVLPDAGNDEIRGYVSESNLTDDEVLIKKWLNSLGTGFTVWFSVT